MNTKTAVSEILSPFASPASKIKALIQRKNAQDLFIPDLLGKRVDDQNKAEANAAETLKAGNGQINGFARATDIPISFVI